MQAETTLYLPPTTQFPVKVISLSVHPSATIKKHDTLLVFEFKRTITEEQTDPDTGKTDQVTTNRVEKTEFESTVEGTVRGWIVKPGSVVHDAKQPIMTVLEDCNHPIQLHGLCAICGKDLTMYVTFRNCGPALTVRPDYSGFSDTSRATINMTHDSTGLTVSQGEAARIERETTERLLKQRKLSLIVDLDQTIIHATVDPTVGEWMEDPEGANYAAVADVEKFKLMDERGGGGGAGGWYYVKMRPGLKRFLDEISRIYELHIYTMGTRNYAAAVAKIIDPDQKMFGERVLSRDESGSMTEKLIARLFPVDTSMVVIIDDRADIWNYSPNLIKVTPYDFFVGIGDINASFLPKKQTIPTTEPVAHTTDNVTDLKINGDDATTATEPAEDHSLQGNGVNVLSPSTSEPNVPTNDDSAASSNSSTSPSSPLDNPNGESSATPESITMADVALTEQTAKLEQQKQDRPLAKRQEELNHDVADTNKAVLHDDDEELTQLESILKEIHTRFFDAIKENLQTEADVKHVIPFMKERILGGTHLAFSGLIPLGVAPQSVELVRMATSFGADVQEQVDRKTTHLVAAKAGTLKVNKVQELNRRDGRKIEIVRPEWLTGSLAQWKRLDESAYRLFHGDDDVSGISVTNDLSSEEEEVPSEGLVMDDMDWGDASREVDEFLAESGDDDGVSSYGGSQLDQSDVEGIRSGNRTPRKRRRDPSDGTVTPSGRHLAVPPKRLKEMGADEDDDDMDASSNGSFDDLANDLEAELA